MEQDMAAILTPKQQKFCDEYLIDLNATRAALRAGYSVNTALNGQLMQLPKIKYYLQQRTAQVSKEAQVTQQMIVSELCKTAFSNMRNYYRSDGTMKGMHELTPDESAALWCMKTTTNADGESTFIRLNNKLSALEKLARHFGLYNTEPAELQPTYVYIEKDKLDKNDQYEDASMVPEEVVDPYKKAVEDAERLRVNKMENVRYNLIHFHPKLDAMLPEPVDLSYAIIAKALRRMPKGKEAWWVTKLRVCKELEVIEGLDKSESVMSESPKDEAERGEESGSPQSGSREDRLELVGDDTDKGEDLGSFESGSRMSESPEDELTVGAVGNAQALVAANVSREPVKITKAMVREMELKNPNFVPFGKWRDRNDPRYRTW